MTPDAGIQKTASVGRRGVGRVKEMQRWNLLDRHLDSSQAALPDLQAGKDAASAKIGPGGRFWTLEGGAGSGSAMLEVRGLEQNPRRVGRRYI